MPPKKEYKFGEIALTLPDEFVYIDKKGRRRKATPITKDKQLASKNKVKSIALKVDKKITAPKLTVKGKKGQVSLAEEPKSVQDLAPSLSQIRTPISRPTSGMTGVALSIPSALPVVPSTTGDKIPEKTQQEVMESIQKKAERRRSRSTRRGRDRTRVPEKAKEPAPATSATTLQDIKEEEGDSIESRMAERQTPSVEDVPGIEDIEQKHQETTRNLDEFLRRQQELEQEAPSQVMEEEGRDEEEEVEEEEEPSIPSYQLTRLRGYITRVEEYDNQISQMNELIKREVDEEARKGQ